MIYWMIGLSGSGKTTLAKATNLYNLDGDEVRKTISKGLGFSLEDRKQHLLNICALALDGNNNGDVIVSTITPTEHIRSCIKKELKDKVKFIYIDCSIEECIERDPKGLYKEKYDKMTGIGSPFEIPKNPDYIISTTKDFQESLSDLLCIIN